MTLLAEDGALKPGQTAWIGLYFDIEQGWHIYWVNPGDSGEAPRVQWDLPERLSRRGYSLAGPHSPGYRQRH